MHLRRILKGTLIVVCLLFLGFQVFNLEFQAAGMRLTLVLLLTILYCVGVPERKMFFLLFLVCFTLAEIINVISFFVKLDYETTLNYFYYGGNILYIISYIFLILHILQEIDIRYILSKFWVHLVILVILDIFCVIIVSGTTEKLLTKLPYILELTYNIVIMILLTVAMINYISKNTQKSMNLLLGAIFIFFSEVLQLTYFYISEISILNVLCSLFLVLAFLFLYLQSRISAEEELNALRQDLYF